MTAPPPPPLPTPTHRWQADDAGCCTYTDSHGTRCPLPRDNRAHSMLADALPHWILAGRRASQPPPPETTGAPMPDDLRERLARAIATRRTR